MRIRLPQQVEVSVNLEADSGGALQIAPLIFISLIENAFKHGISPTVDSFYQDLYLRAYGWYGEM
jgi:hypothetical protein